MQQQQQQPGQGSWQGQNQSYYAPPDGPPQAQGYTIQAPPQQTSGRPTALETQRSASDFTPITLTDTTGQPSHENVPAPTSTGPATGTGASNVDPSRIGLLPKRPVSLLAPKAVSTEAQPPQPAAQDSDDLDYVENPFEDEERHR